MLKLYLNTVDLTWYDADGSLLADSVPQIPFGNSERIAIQCCTDTPDSGTVGIDPEEDWTKDTQFDVSGITALLSTDNNFTRHLKGSVKTAISAGSVSEIELTISGATLGSVPPTGSVRLYDSNGDSEAVEYTARAIHSGKVVFTCADGSSVTNSYDAGADADCPASLYFTARFRARSASRLIPRGQGIRL